MCCPRLCHDPSHSRGRGWRRRRWPRRRRWRLHCCGRSLLGLRRSPDAGLLPEIIGSRRLNFYGRQLCSLAGLPLLLSSTPLFELASLPLLFGFYFRLSLLHPLSSLFFFSLSRSALLLLSRCNCCSGHACAFLLLATPFSLCCLACCCFLPWGCTRGRTRPCRSGRSAGTYARTGLWQRSQTTSTRARSHLRKELRLIGRGADRWRSPHWRTVGATAGCWRWWLSGRRSRRLLRLATAAEATAT
mmetsp:Transcript_109651/g.189719  ORF Transcript_109651/g.189719 Transcript_109651/m.189719 type:complete len:245 (+) Transcript_109651:436-1170(+)